MLLVLLLLDLCRFDRVTAGITWFLCSCSIYTEELLKWLMLLLAGQTLINQPEYARAAGKLKTLRARDLIGRSERIGAQKLVRHVGIDREGGRLLKLCLAHNSKKSEYFFLQSLLRAV